MDALSAVARTYAGLPVAPETPGRPAYICDIDGTIADITHRLHFIRGAHLPGGPDNPDWEAFHDACIHDVPIEPVIKLVQALRPAADILYVTGRMVPWGDQTLGWMHAHSVPVSGLYMRPVGDHRPDYVVKREIFERAIAPAGWDIRGVFDDRDAVVAMWRELGLHCFQVAPGAY